MSQSAKSQPEIIPFGAKALVLVLAVYIIVADKEKEMTMSVFGQK